MHSTRKNGLITLGMQPALEAKFDAVGDEVRGVVEDILMAKYFAIKSPRQQLTPRRLLHSLLSAKASPSVDTRDEASDEAVANAMKATPLPARKKPTPKRKKLTPKNLDNQEAEKKGTCMRHARSSGFLDEGSGGSLAQSYPVKNPRGGATASKGVTGKRKVSFDTVDQCTPTSTAEFVPNVPNAIDVQVVHDDVHTDVDRAKLEKGTLPTPTIVEFGTNAIVDAMVVDACIDAITDATVVHAYTNDIVDAMEVDASTYVVADGNVKDGGTKSIVHAVIDAILDAIEAMGIDTTVEFGTNAIVDAMVVDACTYAIADAKVNDSSTNDIVDAIKVDASIDVATDGNVNDGGIESIVHDVIDTILDAVEAMGTDAPVEDTRGMGEEVLIDREAKTCEVVGASDVTAQAKVVYPSDASNDIVDAEEAKGTDAVVEDMRHNIVEACIEQNNEARKGTKVPIDRAAQSREAMQEDFMVVAVDTKEAVTHDTTESCTDPTVGNTKGKNPEVLMGRAAATDTNEAGHVKQGHCQEALEPFLRMQSDGVLPNAITYTQEEERMVDFTSLSLHNDDATLDGLLAIEVLARKLQEAMSNPALQGVVQRLLQAGHPIVPTPLEECLAKSRHNHENLARS
ncbi:hypothetical protein L7F22_046801 [Adiantum nelumboides]|nr:hypothetical protein [Adiantum nelumboides]